MRDRYYLPFFPAAVLTLLAFFSPLSVADKGNLLLEVYKRSGVEQQFASLEQSMSGSGSSDDALTGAMLDELQGAAGNPFAADKLRPVVQANMDKELSAPMLEKLLDVMGQQVWKNAVRLETQASTRQSAVAMENYLESLYAHRPPRPERVRLIEELADKTGAVDIVMDVMLSTALSVTRMMMSDGDTMPQELEAEMREQMHSFKPAYRDFVLGRLLYTYRYMPDEQLQTYVKYHDLPEIQAFNNAISRGIIQAVK